jgi:NAD(P)-dependent dehydrogenase (short-subunit alcohol dehydrogenase family)
MELKGRVALVTGGAVRVGRAIALELARRGADVGITYRTSQHAVESAVKEIASFGVRAHAVSCDQADPEQVKEAVRLTEEALGPIDILVNSAAVFRRTPLETATLEDWDEHLDVNLRGPWLYAQAVGPGMKRRGWGAIVNLVDVAVEKPFPGYLPYSASKAGLVAITRGLARGLAPEVRVNAIAPGIAEWPDDFPEDQKQPLLDRTLLRRAGSPQDIAGAAAYLTLAPYVTGVILPVDGGLRLG